MSENVAILGASDKQDRYSHKALVQLRDHGHRPIPIHPHLKEVEGYEVLPDLKALIDKKIKVDTVTMYVNPAVSSKVTNELLSLRPRRVIFNPGSENPELAKSLKQAGIEVVEGCTLVMLSIGNF